MSNAAPASSAASAATLTMAMNGPGNQIDRAGQLASMIVKASASRIDPLIAASTLA
jgi:hypothetical protein